MILRYSHSSEHLIRFSLRHEPRRVLYGDISPGRPFRRHRLVYPSRRHKRKAQRHEVMHRDHESLFGPQWARCCVIRFSLHPVVRMCRAMTLCVRIFLSDDRDVRVCNQHRCVCVVFVYHPHAPVPLQGIRFRTSSASGFPTFAPILYLFVDHRFITTFTTICVSCLLSCTATSTKSPPRPASHSAACSSSWPRPCSKPTRIPTLKR